MAEQLTIIAPAKVNLYLGIGERRPDGYHEVVTILQALELHDTLTLTPSDAFTVSCVPDLGLPTCDNLAAVAGRVFGGVQDREPLVSVEIGKHIPVGAGLGGGSTDAAAVLVGLTRLWGLPADETRLAFAGRSVGTDVPFFFAGGTALYGGRGDELIERYPTPMLDVVLVNPGEPVSTSAAYTALAEHRGGAAGGPDAVIAALSTGDPAAVARALHNDMSAVAAALVPNVGDALEWVRGAAGVLGACVAGSGSTVFGVCEGPARAKEVAAAARTRGWWAAATRTRETGVAVDVASEDGPGVGA